VAPGGSLLDRVQRLQAIRNEGQVTRSLMEARCHRGAQIARNLGFSTATAEAIRALDEHWDGRGQPVGLRGEQIPAPARILCLSQTIEVFHRTAGVDTAYRVAERRSGEWFDPALVDALNCFRADAAFWASLADEDISAVEPPDRLLLADEDRMDAIAEGFADVIDAKSPWTHDHSDTVSQLAAGIGSVLGLDATTLRDLRRAALLHDIGKLSVSNRILDKPGPLTESERRSVEQHPVLTQRIMEAVPGLDQLAPVASAHHERLDGSGYPRGLSGEQLTVPMRALGVADVYEALTSHRPYRAAFPPEVALSLMRQDVPERLDPNVFAALETFLSATDVAGDRLTRHGP
jgi:HD-GYP domain-containing protein (c-di-GMP phosphodiesterase class II)